MVGKMHLHGSFIFTATVVSNNSEPIPYDSIAMICNHIGNKLPKGFLILQRPDDEL